MFHNLIVVAPVPIVFRRSRIISRIYRAIALCLLLMVVAPMATSAADPEVTKFRFGALYSTPTAALIAIERGYFKDEGLDVQVIPVQNGPAAVAATANGAVDVTFGDVLGWASAVSNGFTNVKLIFPGSHSANGDLLIKGQSALKSPADFKGKRIGVSPAPMAGLSVKLWLAQGGVDPAEVNFVIIPTNGDGQALARGDVDAVLTFEPSTSRLILEQNAVSLLDPTEVGAPKGAVFTAYYANSTFLEKNPETVRRLVRAIGRGAALNKSLSPTERAIISGKYSGIDLVKLSQTTPGLLERLKVSNLYTGAVNAAATQDWIDKAVKYGAVPRSIEIKSYIYESALHGDER
ncbi:MAG: ABC transporter substrate-binding protein [Afipia sp.]